jgi:hypothetical protein
MTLTGLLRSANSYRVPLSRTAHRKMEPLPFGYVRCTPFMNDTPEPYSIGEFESGTFRNHGRFEPSTPPRTIKDWSATQETDVPFTHEHLRFTETKSRLEIVDLPKVIEELRTIKTYGVTWEEYMRAHHLCLVTGVATFGVDTADAAETFHLQGNLILGIKIWKPTQRCCIIT